MPEPCDFQILKAELESSHRLSEIGLAVAAHAEHLQEQLDSAEESLASASLRAHSAEQFVEKTAGLAEQRNAERDAKVAELEKRIAEHVCAGPTTINLTENAAVQEYTAELRRELAEERNHVRQHKATIDNHAATIEKLREQIRQAQQDAAKGPAPDIVRLQQDLQASETARANAENRLSVASQVLPDYMTIRESVTERLGRVKELLHTGPYDQVGREIEEALKELAGVPF